MRENIRSNQARAKRNKFGFLAISKFAIMLNRLFLLLFLTVLVQAAVFAQAGSLGFTIRTDKERYVLGEPVNVTITWQNVTDKNFEIATHTMMEAVSVFDEAAKKELQYRGVIACGKGGRKKLAAGEKMQLQNVLNHFLFPNYDLNTPGRYSVKSSYSSNNFDKQKDFWTGQVTASATFEIVKLDEDELNSIRERALEGDKQALQILAAHQDETIVPALAGLIKTSNKELRETIYRALFVINTDVSVRVLPEILASKIPPEEKLIILRSLHDMKPSPNPVIIPYLEKMLSDDYVGGYVGTQKEGEPPKRYKVYTIRKWASFTLKKLGIETNTVFEEEIAENTSQN